MYPIGSGEAIVMNMATEDGRPMQFTWRQNRYQVHRLESTKKNKVPSTGNGRLARRTFRIRTTSGLRCTISQDESRRNWRMERVLNARGV